MVVLQELSRKLFFNERSSNHQRSTLLVDIMNATGFSKSEREIHIHSVHIRNAIVNIFQSSDKNTITLTGSTSEGLCGGLYDNKSHHDYDFLFTHGNIKLSTPRTNNISNPPLLLLHDNEEYDAFFLSTMTTFKDMSNYHWRN